MKEWLRDWKFWAWAAPAAAALLGTGLYAAEQIQKVPPLEEAVQNIAAERQAVREITCYTLKLCALGKIRDKFTCRDAETEATKRKLECEEGE